MSDGVNKLRQDVLLSEATATLEGFSGDAPLVIADPPYGIGYHSNYYKTKNPHSPISHDWNFQIGSFLNATAKALADGGAMYLFCRYDVTPIWVPYLEPAGLKLKTIIAWVKDNWSAGDLTGSFGNQYECIIFAVKGRHKLRGKRWSNVWEFPRIPAKRLLHPAQKPTPLLIRAIESSSDEGDVVVDPFCGSGSTGEAAQQSGRGYVLGDIDKDMVRISRVRLGLIAEEQTTATFPAPTLSLPEQSPLEWGLHPEDLRALKDQFSNSMIDNRVKDRQAALFSDED